MTQTQTTTPDIEQIYATLMMQRAIEESKDPRAAPGRVVKWRSPRTQNRKPVVKQATSTDRAEILRRGRDRREEILALLGDDEMSTIDIHAAMNEETRGTVKAIASILRYLRDGRILDNRVVQTGMGRTAYWKVIPGAAQCTGS